MRTLGPVTALARCAVVACVLDPHFTRLFEAEIGLFVTSFPTSTQHSAEHSRKSVCEKMNVLAITHSLDLVANLVSYIC